MLDVVFSVCGVSPDVSCLTLRDSLLIDLQTLGRSELYLLLLTAVFVSDNLIPLLLTD